MDDKIRDAIREVTMKSPADRLEKVLLDNRGTYSIKNDGSVVVDFNHPKVKAKIQNHLDKLKEFKIPRVG